jgi:AAA family ATPase
MRPGRLDRIIYVGPPDQAAREEILKIKTKKMTTEPNLDILEIAKLVRLGKNQMNTFC